MPKKHTVASAKAAAVAPPLPARFLEILAALPVPAWVENSRGKILAHNFGLAECGKKSCQHTLDFPGAHASRMLAWASRPSPKTGVRRDVERSTRDACTPQAKVTPSLESWKITSYPLPPVAGFPQRLRLVALVPGACENDCHARVVSALLSLLLHATRSDGPQFSPQQSDIYRELTRGSSYKETAYTLGISHDTLRVQVTRMRKRLGDGIVPRLRNAPAAGGK